jgi:4-diphosphocytidyl-2-C-methyl-D-erythritol kinase
VSDPQPSTAFTARARAKVNLCLDVLRRRRDGYHEIETIFQSIDLYDTLDIAFDDSGTVRITCTDPDIPTDEHNICHKAIVELRGHLGPELGAAIHIDKQIPHSAGLGGGSADAAAILLAAGRLAPGQLGGDTLAALALNLGSDVPFMLTGGTALGRGRGEILSPLTGLKGCFFLIVKPTVDISTREVYERVSLSLTKHRYRINLKAVNTLLARFPKVALTFRNALEDVVCPMYPKVAETLGSIMEHSPRFAAMSGSGSALFAIFESESKASVTAEIFSARGYFTAVVGPARQAVELTPRQATRRGS